MSLLELRNVSFSYSPGREVLSGLSFAVEAGSVVAILGSNGAGKSTILDICLGWRRPLEGSVMLGDVPLARCSRRERGMLMSLVPQRENLRFDFTVAEYALLGRAPHLRPLQTPGMRDREEAEAALRQAGIYDLRNRPITTLSGGEYQLLLIARSLAQNPQLLLLDEPASHLDPANQLRITRLIRELSRNETTVLFTSHHPQAAAELADTMHLLVGGRFRWSGRPREVVTEEHLRLAYGVPFRITWIGGSPHIQAEPEGAS